MRTNTLLTSIAAVGIPAVAAYDWRGDAAAAASSEVIVVEESVAATLISASAVSVVPSVTDSVDGADVSLPPFITGVRPPILTGVPNPFPTVEEDVAPVVGAPELEDCSDVPELLPLVPAETIEPALSESVAPVATDVVVAEEICEEEEEELVVEEVIAASSAAAASLIVFESFEIPIAEPTQFVCGTDTYDVTEAPTTLTVLDCTCSAGHDMPWATAIPTGAPVAPEASESAAAPVSSAAVPVAVPTEAPAAPVGPAGGPPAGKPWGEKPPAPEEDSWGPAPTESPIVIGGAGAVTVGLGVAATALLGVVMLAL